MLKIKQRFIVLLVVLAVLTMSIAVDVPTAKANYPSETSYTFENGLPPRTVYCDSYTNVIIFQINNVNYNISIDSNYISYAYCSKDGTLWFESAQYGETGFPLYWVNFELEGKDMTPHYFNEGAFHVDADDWADEYINHITDEKFPLPTFDDLKNYLENGVPVPGSKPKPAADPEPSTEPQPTTGPNSSEQKKVTIKKVTTSKNTINLIDNNNKIIDKAIFNKKKSTLSYNNKKITKVKGAWFTKKGSLVYLKTNSKAYYIKGKKSKLIKSKVASVKTSKKFATALKLKNGKTYKLKQLTTVIHMKSKAKNLSILKLSDCRQSKICLQSFLL